MKKLEIVDRIAPMSKNGAQSNSQVRKILCPILRGLTAGQADCAIVLPRENANELLFSELENLNGNRDRHIAALLCADPFITVEKAASRLKELQVNSVTNWPSGIFFEGKTIKSMAAIPAGWQQEYAWLSKSRQLGLVPYAFVLSLEQGLAALAEGITRIILHPGLPHGLNFDAKVQLSRSLENIANSLKQSPLNPEIYFYKHPQIFSHESNAFDWANGIVDYSVRA